MDYLRTFNKRSSSFTFICLQKQTRRILYATKGRGMGIIFKGKLKGFIGTQGITMEEGDSINFDCTLPHLWGKCRRWDGRGDLGDFPSFLLNK